MKFIRGDTYKFKFQRKDLDDNPILIRAEKLWFTVKKNYNTSNIAIQKTLQGETIKFDSDSGWYHVTIDSKDTQKLKYKKYVCDIQVQNGGVVKTLYKGTVELDKEVTFEGGYDN